MVMSKTLASVMSSVGGVLLAGLAFLYAGYRNKNKREFENPLPMRFMNDSNYLMQIFLMAKASNMPLPLRA